jgi:hypothetical protein
MRKVAGCAAFFGTVFTLLLVASPAASAARLDPRVTLFCDLATKHFAAFLPASPAKEMDNYHCKLGSPAKGEVDVYFPTLGSDSLERERIVSKALNAQIVDEPDFGEQAFSISIDKGLDDPHGNKVYSVQYWVRRNAQIFSITLKRNRPFATADYASARADIKAFLSELD